jgi:hypothetical protein
LGAFYNFEDAINHIATSLGIDEKVLHFANAKEYPWNIILTTSNPYCPVQRKVPTVSE